MKRVKTKRIAFRKTTRCYKDNKHYNKDINFMISSSRMSICDMNINGGKLLTHCLQYIITFGIKVGHTNLY